MTLLPEIHFGDGTIPGEIREWLRRHGPMTANQLAASLHCRRRVIHDELPDEFDTGGDIVITKWLSPTLPLYGLANQPQE